jgi:hypothetical protein
MTVNRKCCDPAHDSKKKPRTRPTPFPKPPKLHALDRLNGWTTTKLKKLRKGAQLKNLDVLAPIGL